MVTIAASPTDVGTDAPIKSEPMSRAILRVERSMGFLRTTTTRPRRETSLSHPVRVSLRDLPCQRKVRRDPAACQRIGVIAASRQPFRNSADDHAAVEQPPGPEAIECPGVELGAGPAFDDQA